MNSSNPQINPILVLAIFIWTFFWKILALWKAAKYNQKNWFFAIIIINGATIGILEIIYLFRFAREKMTLKELKSILRLGPKS